jgi:4-alpha-glucanotransferase
VTAIRHGRHAGVIVPTFSLRSASDWGVGELPDLAGMAAWLAAAGQGSLHTLPLVERAAHERSPYSALTAFAIDSIHIGVDAVEDFVAAGGRRALGDAGRDRIGRLREHPAIDYDGVRTLKERALELAFAHFERTELATASARARRFAAFEAAERAWLGDYVLYRALHARHGEASWLTWPDALRRRDATACAEARRALGRRLRCLAYVQWIAHEQLATARCAAAACGVEILGDLPFTVAVDSADVWSRQADFDVEVSIGAPPDAFNAEGQDWSLPAFRWDAVRADDHAWLRDRVAHVARWLDGARLDHVVGYFRTYLRARGAEPRFDPPDPEAQRALGAAALDAVVAAGGAVRLIAEDLGDVPAFVREEMVARDLPGYRVLRWENDGPVFRDPTALPACSIATSGTHDTSALAAWWSDELDDEAREQLTAVPAFAALREAGPEFTPIVHEELVDAVYAAGSDTALLVIPDVFGSPDRINTPATIGNHNWRYRLPLAIEELAGAKGRARAAWLREVARRHGRVV